MKIRKIQTAAKKKVILCISYSHIQWLNTAFIQDIMWNDNNIKLKYALSRFSTNSIALPFYNSDSDKRDSNVTYKHP